MATFSSHLIHREEIADGTMAFRFEKPEGFSFKAGQHVSVRLIDPPETDEEGNKRTFSLITAPYEDHIAVATRMRDTAFKRVLKTMPIGTPVEIIDPRGSMTLHVNTDRPAVFLAGGIGITPFRSMIRHAIHEKLEHKIILFYSNRTPESAAFLDELAETDRQILNFTLIATMTDMASSTQPWSGQTGYITEEMIRGAVGDGMQPVYYLAGPPGMVAAMNGVLERLGVSEDDIRSEEFSGYGS